MNADDTDFTEPGAVATALNRRLGLGKTKTFLRNEMNNLVVGLNQGMCC